MIVFFFGRIRLHVRPSFCDEEAMIPVLVGASISDKEAMVSVLEATFTNGGAIIAPLSPEIGSRIITSPLIGKI